MASIADRINLVYIFFSLLSEALVSKHYQENLDLENKLFMHPPVDSQHSKSVLRCACFCVRFNECNCFSFNPQRCVGFIFCVIPLKGQLVKKDGDHTATARYNLLQAYHSQVCVYHSLQCLCFF